jgi:hypothetical protein
MSARPGFHGLQLDKRLETVETSMVRLHRVEAGVWQNSLGRNANAA